MFESFSCRVSGDRIFKSEKLSLPIELKFEVTVKLYKESKTLAQLGYYWGVIVKLACAELGTDPKALDRDLREAVLTPVVSSGLYGEKMTYKRISDMKVDEMSDYIDKVIMLLSQYDVLVPPPYYKG